jgi:serine/threonine-protein kinase RsbW
MSRPAGSLSPAQDTMAYGEADDLAAVRAFVRSRAAALGLPERRVEMLGLVVSELATNTLQYTAGGGRVRVWAESGQLYCDVVDGGPVRAIGEMPPASAVRGRGLAIVRRVADDVDIIPGSEGTLVRVRMALSPAQLDA